jgi:hypothetical protein
MNVTRMTAIAAGVFCSAALLFGTVSPASAAGANGTTLAASKTVDICRKDDGNWKYSGEISVWNQGAVATQGLNISDCIENKIGSQPFVHRYCQSIVPSQTPSEIPPGTTQLTAIVYSYSFDAAPLTGTIRNNALLTIMNHSGSLGKPKGPNPKATYTGPIPPPLCAVVGGGDCVHSQGYWKSKPGVVWPAPFDRNATFFNSGLTYQGILNNPPGGNGYYILAIQYIAAVLNKANGAAVPSGVQTIINDATTFFTTSGNAAAACPTNSSCGLQKTWGGILETYNTGTYPGGPAHCGDDN